MATIFRTISNVFRRAYVAIDNFLESFPTHSFENGNRAYWSYYDEKRHCYIQHRLRGPSYFKRTVRLEGIFCYYRYYQYGRLHRVDGPALVGSWGPHWLEEDTQWYINNKCITELVKECLEITGFPEDVHLGILAERMTDLNDFRLFDAIQEPVDEDNPHGLAMYLIRGEE